MAVHLAALAQQLDLGASLQLEVDQTPLVQVFVLYYHRPERLSQAGDGFVYPRFISGCGGENTLNYFEAFFIHAQLNCQIGF